MYVSRPLSKDWQKQTKKNPNQINPATHLPFQKSQEVSRNKGQRMSAGLSWASHHELLEKCPTHTAVVTLDSEQEPGKLAWISYCLAV